MNKYFPFRTHPIPIRGKGKGGKGSQFQPQKQAPSPLAALYADPPGPECRYPPSTAISFPPPPSSSLLPHPPLSIVTDANYISPVKKIIIAIDGYSACGKSTLARQLAGRLGYVFLDTGAMYRAVTLYLLRHQVDWMDGEALASALKAVNIHMTTDSAGRTCTYLNGEFVEEEIRGMAVSNKVSEVAAVSAVRRFLVHLQQELGKHKGVVMDGRDIGTVVFPQAELKLFVIADMETRIQRRFLELQSNGVLVTDEEIRQNLIKRDLEETTRTDSPLRQAEDAIVLDNSAMTQEQQLDFALKLALAKMEETADA